MDVLDQILQLLAAHSDRPVADFLTSQVEAVRAADRARERIRLLPLAEQVKAMNRALTEIGRLRVVLHQKHQACVLLFHGMMSSMRRELTDIQFQGIVANLNLEDTGGVDDGLR